MHKQPEVYLVVFTFNDVVKLKEEKHMIFKFKDVVTHATGSDGRILPVLSLIQRGDTDTLLTMDVVQSNVPAGMLLTCSDAVPLDPFVTLYGSYTMLTQIGAPTDDVISQLTMVAGLYNITIADFLAVLSDADNVMQQMTGASKLQEKIVPPNNHKLKAVVSALNKLSGFTETTVLQTLQMRTCEDIINLKLDNVPSIMSGLYNDGNISQLIQLPDEHTKILWRQHGVKEDELIGSGECDATYPLPNEELIVSQLKSLSSQLKAKLNSVTMTTAFEDYINALIYRACRANWKHTGLTPLMSLLEDDGAEDDGSSEDTSDIDGNDKEDAATQAGDKVYDYYLEPGANEYLERLLRDAGMSLDAFRDILDQINSLIKDSEHYIKAIKGIGDDIDYRTDLYIECFVKLLRWGNRRVKRLKLSNPNRYIDTDDLFKLKDDNSCYEPTIVKQFGKTFSPIGTIYYGPNVNIPIERLVSLEIPPLPSNMPVGLLATKQVVYLDSPTQAKEHIKVWLDAYSIIEHKDDILGLQYNESTGKFEYEEGMKVDANSFVHQVFCGGCKEMVVPEKYVSGDKIEYEADVPQCIEDIVLPLDLDDKKRAGLFYSLVKLSEWNPSNPTEAETKLLFPQREVFKALGDIDTSYDISLMDVLNAINPVIGTIKPVTTKIPELSNKFASAGNPPNNRVEEEVAPKFVPPTLDKPIPEAYTIFSEERKVPVCYIVLRPLKLVSLDTIVDTPKRSTEFDSQYNAITFLEGQMNKMREVGKLSEKAEATFTTFIQYLKEVE